MPRLLAISDLHVGHRGNEDLLDRVDSGDRDDWLIVAGDVCERSDDLDRTLATLRPRFAKVIWVPGNHELYTTVRDPMQVHGVTRYDYLVQICRDNGVLTPEDPFPIFEDPSLGPVTIAPMFLLYDYSFRDENLTKLEALAKARAANVVATDEFLLSCEPYATRDAWCRERLEYTRKRLDVVTGPTVLINHWPLRREPTNALFYQDFALWCGTTATADWHLRYNAVCSVYGHLHIPRTTWYDGVRFEEVSVGYPREWKRRGLSDPFLRPILPVPGYTESSLGEWGVHFEVSPEEAEKAKEQMQKVSERMAAAGRAAGARQGESDPEGGR